MTAQELIEILKQYPPETKILVNGYEDNYEDIAKIKFTGVVQNSSAAWYYGEYKETVNENPATIKALLIERNQRKIGL